MKKILTLFVLLFSINALFAQSDKTVARQSINFNKDWKFILADNPAYREANFDDSSWRVLSVPHDWSIEGEYTPDHPAGKNNGYFPEGLGWYRKSFSLPKDMSNKQIVVQFDGVFMNSEVWINGFFLGRRPYGYSTFRYDLTSYLKFGEGVENVISVRVDNSVPGADRWYHGSGIYRDVHLLVTNYVHFKHNGGVYITTPVAEEHSAVVNVDYELFGTYFTDKEINLYKRNAWSRSSNSWKNEPLDHDCIIRSIVYDAAGKEVARTEKNYNIRNYDVDYKVSQQVLFDNPKRWSANTPNLYTMRSEIEFNGKILDDVVTKFGVRKIEYLPSKGMYVNGEMVKLHGVCLHHTAGSVGVAVHKKTIIHNLNRLKELGCNAIRTAHNPFSPTFYAVCDSLGFYVNNEAFDEWRCGWAVNWTENNTGKSLRGYNLLFDQWAETDLRDLIKRDRNNPSVVMWSVGNEIPDYRHYKDAGVTAKWLADIAKEEDPTRPVTVGDNGFHSTDSNGTQDAMDILGFNYVERDTGEEMYAPVHAKRPDKLIMGSETNKEMQYILAVRDNDYVIGQFIWTGIDYLGEVKGKEQRGWNTSLLDLTLNKRADGALFSCCWSAEPKLFVTSSLHSALGDEESYINGASGEKVVIEKERLFNWNWDNDGANKYVVIYTNCDEVELKVNGKSLGRKKNDWSKYFVEFEVPYKEGKLEAVGYRNGKKVVFDKLETTGEAVAIKATPVWKTLEKDGLDIAILDVCITDSKGRTVPTAQNNIKVKVEGGATLVGIDSPNLIYTGSFKADNRDAFEGHLMVTIQSNGSTEPVKVTLTSDGLATAEVKF